MKRIFAPRSVQKLESSHSCRVPAVVAKQSANLPLPPPPDPHSPRLARRSRMAKEGLPARCGALTESELLSATPSRPILEPPPRSGRGQPEKQLPFNQ